MSASTATGGSQGRAFSSLMNEQYRISKRLGGGSFGDIYLGIGQNGEQVAVKFEKHSTRCPQLRHEYKVYRELQNCAGFGRVYYYGTYNNYNAMVMDLLGPSLEDLFTKCGRRFSLRTVLQVADQLLERMETMHSRYASINNHLGLEQSRRDDLESIGFVLIYFLKGSLPWQGLKARNAKRKYKIIMERKQTISIQQLCQGLPQQFAEYLAYCRSLKFEAKPNVPYLQGLLRELYKVQGHPSSGAPDWDWSKFEAQPGSIEGDAIVNTACGETSTPIKTAEAPQVPDVWQAPPVEAKTVKANIPMMRSKEEEREVANSGVGCEHDGLGASPASKWLVAEDDGKYKSNVVRWNWGMQKRTATGLNWQAGSATLWRLTAVG
eukprot:g12377.t1